ncbi:hypothetical protein UPYG_G00104280 [Umbra pygmaea]|uniref:Uncharacterized protein n=1 Tax=Umbra pygmaea TaxID=75934 RepID=A0ABD0XH60_UMBPY
MRETERRASDLCQSLSEQEQRTWVEDAGGEDLISWGTDGEDEDEAEESDESASEEEEDKAGEGDTDCKSLDAESGSYSPTVLQPRRLGQ